MSSSPVPRLPSSPQIIVECASNHGGNLTIAQDMIDRALGAGADLVKFQAYNPVYLNHTDPASAWLTQSALSAKAQKALWTSAPEAVFFSVFDAETVQRLRRLGLKRFKVGHADAWRQLWKDAPDDETWYVSFAWSRFVPRFTGDHALIRLAVAPIYPAPLETFAALTNGVSGLLDWCEGYSDHTLGVTACQIALAQGVSVVEKHFSCPGCLRRQDWDLDPDQLAQLVTWRDLVVTARYGTPSRHRWGPERSAGDR